MGFADDGCFTFLSRNVLIGINLLLAVSGLMLCAGGAYLYVEYDSQFDELVSPEPIIGVMVAGFTLFAITLLGVYGAVTGKRIALVIYLCIVVALIAVEVAAAVIFLNYLEVIESTDDADSGELRDSTQIAINNFIYESYYTCCEITENCVDDALLNLCTGVELCPNATTTVACIQADEITEVDRGVCTALQEFTFEDKAIVGQVRAGNAVTCGGGIPQQFESAVTGWLRENVNFFGYGAIALGVVQVLIVIFGVVLVIVKPSLIPQAREVRDDGTDDAAHRLAVYADPVRVDSQSSRKSAQRMSAQRMSAQSGLRPVSHASSLSSNRRSKEFSY